jgi:hypothetical protein
MKKVIIITCLILAACSRGPSPKDTVFEFIDAVKSSDSLRVAKLLDMDAYIKSRMSAMSSEDSAKVLNDYRVKTIQSLLGDGLVRGRFMHDLIVVNKEVLQDSLAEVEVSFVDQQAGQQLYTKMQLRHQPDRTWRIIYFR